MHKLAIVVVTYKRQELLEDLLKSMLMLETAPWRVFIVDNENSPATKEIVRVYGQIASEGITAVDWPDGASTFQYVPLAENTGGSGGFSHGVRCAYEAGAEWFWLMDDDVVVLPDAIGKLDKWTDRFDMIQGSRLDFDGGPFYWQYHFIEAMGMYDPLATSKFTESGYKPMNAVCFEGGLFNRHVVEGIGYPDSRFFIYWDDCIYGYLASKRFKAAVISDVVLQRTREVRNWEVTGVRQLNSSSNMTRFHVMRNRGYIAKYLKLNGDYNPVGFAAGTAFCAAKEVIRLISVDRVDLRSGLGALVDGWRQARRIMSDDEWAPMIDVLPPSLPAE